MRKSNKKIRTRTAVFLLLCIMPLVLSGCGVRDFFDSLLDPLAKWITDVTNPIGGAVDEVFISDTSIMTTILNTPGLFQIRKMIKSTAIGLIGFLFLLGVIDEVSGSWDIKGLIRPAVKAAVAIYVVDHFNTLRTALDASGKSLIKASMDLLSQTTTQEVSAVKDALVKALKLEWVYNGSSVTQSIVEALRLLTDATSNTKIMEMLLELVLILFLALWLWVIKLQCLMQCYSAIIELALLESMFPLGCAWLANDGLRGQGGRYIKRICAAYIKIALFAVICMIYQSVAIKELEGGLMPFMISAIALGFSAVELMKGCTQVADTIMGV